MQKNEKEDEKNGVIASGGEENLSFFFALETFVIHFLCRFFLLHLFFLGMNKQASKAKSGKKDKLNFWGERKKVEGCWA
jgi:hypothetical protein